MLVNSKQLKKDIEFLPVKNIHLAIVKGDPWQVYILNRSDEKIENVLITSKGYGEKDGEQQKTSILRHMIPQLEQGEYGLIEPIDEQVFHLNNEYWISYYVGSQMYDKKYIFVPGSISEDHLIHIPEIESMGILHH